MLSLRMDGLDELKTAMNGLSSRVSRRILRDALVHAAEPMKERMEQLAPHEPGKPDIKDMIVLALPRTANEPYVEVGPARKAFYGSFQEFGTSQFPAQPFARPAFDQTKDEVLQRLVDDIWASLSARGVMRVGTSGGDVTGGPGGSTL